MKPDVHSYISDRVFDGIRILTEKQRQEHLERLKRQLEKNHGRLAQSVERGTLNP